MVNAQVVAQCSSQAAAAYIYLGETVTDSSGHHEVLFPKGVARPTVMLFGATDEFGEFQVATPEEDVVAEQNPHSSSSFHDSTRMSRMPIGFSANCRPRSPIPAKLLLLRTISPPILSWRTWANAFGETQAVFINAMTNADTAEKTKETLQNLDPRGRFADERLQFEEDHRGTLSAVGALHAIVRWAAGEGDPESKISTARVIAVGRLITH